MYHTLGSLATDVVPGTLSCVPTLLSSFHHQVYANLKDTLHFVSDASLDSGQTNGCLCSKVHGGSCK